MQIVVTQMRSFSERALIPASGQREISMCLSVDPGLCHVTYRRRRQISASGLLPFACPWRPSCAYNMVQCEAYNKPAIVVVVYITVCRRLAIRGDGHRPSATLRLPRRHRRRHDCHLHQLATRLRSKCIGLRWRRDERPHHRKLSNRSSVTS